MYMRTYKLSQSQKIAQGAKDKSTEQQQQQQ
jgi:hypothetical protein